jgi:beta-N-acetylhexosaminidase
MTSGFKESITCKDMYQQLATFKAPQYVLDRASSSGVTFTPLTPSGVDECLAAQESKFPQWAGGYRLLHAENQHDDIMVALDHDGKQIGWTLMLSPGRSRLWYGFAFLPVAGGPDGNFSGTGKTALIAAVGVDEEARGKGVGLGLICAAMEEMKRRGGIDGVFIDSVELNNFYEKIGFETWKNCVDMSIQH